MIELKLRLLNSMKCPKHKKEVTVKDFFNYGEKVFGYDVLVLNEREARAAAGILFVGAFLGLTNGVMLGTAVFSKYFITFFAIDFTIRIIQPRYAPSLLLGRMFVSNQKPEYVGAIQKRFAWILGFLLAWPMFYFLVIDPQSSPLKLVVCLLCMMLLFLESAFSICLGCKLFNLFKKEKVTHCPGGACEMKIKDPVQKFTGIQKSIVALTLVAMLYGIYGYMTKLPNLTNLGDKITSIFMTPEEFEKRIEAQKYEESDKF